MQHTQYNEKNANINITHLCRARINQFTATLCIRLLICVCFFLLFSKMQNTHIGNSVVCSLTKSFQLQASPSAPKPPVRNASRSPITQSAARARANRQLQTVVHRSCTHATAIASGARARHSPLSRSPSPPSPSSPPFVIAM